MNKLDKLLKKTEKIVIDSSSKIVIMSDCHRGIGNLQDNFRQNRNLFESALQYYYKNDYTYIELGDGDDMWEVNNYDEIIHENLDTFLLLKKFHSKKRLYMLYGNHDRCKESNVILRKYFYSYYDEIAQVQKDLLKDLKTYESLVLDYNGNDLFLIHGHQGDLLNDTLWKFSRFLVRYIWRPLEKIGFHDPTSAAKNNKVSNRVEKRLKKWSDKHKKIIIAGHTHRAVLPEEGESLYFNDGSCVHPNGITCLEIFDGKITLVKWSYKTGDDDVIKVSRESLTDEEEISKYFSFK